MDEKGYERMDALLLGSHLLLPNTLQFSTFSTYNGPSTAPRYTVQFLSPYDERARQMLAPVLESWRRTIRSASWLCSYKQLTCSLTAP